jgi:hypothetical protein
MKLAYSIKQKTKVAFLLFGIMLCIILVRLLEDKNIKEMGKAFTSLYNDRLIPATDLFFISEKLYAKRYALEMFVNANNTNNNQLKNNLVSFNNAIDSLLKKYEKTFLVANEKSYLLDLKNKLAANRLVEQNILKTNDFSNSELRNKANVEIENSFKGISDKLAELTQVQTKVGEELIKNSETIVFGSKLYSIFQFVLAIIIGVLIVSILFASKVINVKNDKFNLN